MSKSPLPIMMMLGMTLLSSSKPKSAVHKKLMKTIVIIVSIIQLTCMGIARAQGTLALSNLGQTSITNISVGSDSWLLQGFFTGTNTGGYELNSVQLLLGAAAGNPSGFTVSLYNMANNGDTGSSLAQLNGSANPLTPSLYTYTASGITLLPKVPYAIVVTATTPIATGAYDWRGVGSPGFLFPQQWGFFNLSYSSSDGLNWNVTRAYFFQMGIYATPVPEPGTGALICLGLAGLILWRRKRRGVHL